MGGRCALRDRRFQCSFGSRRASKQEGRRCDASARGHASEKVHHSEGRRFLPALSITIVQLGTSGRQAGKGWLGAKRAPTVDADDAAPFSRPQLGPVGPWRFLLRRWRRGTNARHQRPARSPTADARARRRHRHPRPHQRRRPRGTNTTPAPAADTDARAGANTNTRAGADADARRSAAPNTRATPTPAHTDAHLHRLRVSATGWSFRETGPCAGTCCLAQPVPRTYVSASFHAEDGTIDSTSLDLGNDKRSSGTTTTRHLLRCTSLPATPAQQDPGSGNLGVQQQLSHPHEVS